MGNKESNLNVHSIRGIKTKLLFVEKKKKTSLYYEICSVTLRILK